MMATANPEPALRRFVPVAAARGLLAILVVAYATISLTGAVHTLPQSAGHWIAGMLLAMAGALCVARVFMVPGQRVAWLAIGIGFLSWAEGEVLFAAVPSLARGPLSLANILSLAFFYCSKRPWNQSRRAALERCGDRLPRCSAERASERVRSEARGVILERPHA